VYLSIYYNLCSSKSKLKSEYKSGSGLHKHHIVPKHMGGTDEQTNLTYLTVREHVLAHFLLWKIYKNPNDLRAMHMLGAELSVAQRKLIGFFCRDNGIGFHSDKHTKETKLEWSTKGLESQKQSDDTNSFYWWSTEEGRKKRASMGGSIGGKISYEKKTGLHDPQYKSEWCSLGGQSHTGKKWMNKDRKRIRVFPSEIENYLVDGWKLGSGTNKKKGSSTERKGKRLLMVNGKRTYI